MRVAFVGQPIGDVVTGDDSVNLVTRELAQRLASSCEVTVYGAGSGGERQIDSVCYRRIALDRDLRLHSGLAGRLLARARPPRRPLLASPLWAPFFWRDLARRIAREPPDIVHVHNFSQVVPIVARAVPRTPIVLQMHCDWLARFSASMLEPRLAQAACVLGVSRHITQQIRTRFPQLDDRCATLYNGVAVERFGAAARPAAAAAKAPLRLLYVGRISPEKGVHVLLEAVQRLLASGTPVQLTLVGAEQLAPVESVAFDPDPVVRALAPLYRPGYEDSLREALSSRSAACVTFAGFVDHTDLPRRYANADVCVVPSIWDEAFGLPVVEALAAGLPVVATRVGGPAEIVQDGRCGLLVERNDAAALAAALQRLAAEPELRARLSTAARRHARAFSWDRAAERLREHYEALLSDRREVVHAEVVHR